MLKKRQKIIGVALVIKCSTLKRKRLLRGSFILKEFIITKIEEKSEAAFDDCVFKLIRKIKANYY